MNRELEKGLMLFTPQVDQPDLVMEDSAVEVGEETYVTLVVQNHGMEPVQLDSGMRLGEVVPIELVERERGEMAEEASVKRLEPSIETAGDRVAYLLEQLDLRLEHLTQTQRQQIIRLLSSYADTFALNPSELGTTQLVTHSIDTGEHRPIRQPVRRTPFALRGKIEEMVQEMLQQGVIEPSRSPWASPIVLVKRKDGGVRFCVDYRKLNAVTKLDEFPLPRIDDTLDLLAGSCFFTTLDLASGFWQVRMEPTSQERTAFTTFAGLYEFKKMPFGLANAPATFQRLMEVVLSGLARDACLVYLDDIIVIGKTLEQHNAHLEQVLTRIREAGLRLKLKKCKVAQQKVEYLGHVVSAEGVRTDPKKQEAVAKYPPANRCKEPPLLLRISLLL